MDDIYWMLGEISIPESRKVEFNNEVLKLLKACGIRKLEEITLDGKIVTVACEPKPDEKGIVYFDYSIYERKKRETSSYDINTCMLHAEECGYMEFGVVMNLVMTMQEAYSEKPCYLMEKDCLADIRVCAMIIEATIGLVLSFENRAKSWDTLLFLKEKNYCNGLTFREWMNLFPYGYCKEDVDQFYCCVSALRKSVGVPEKTINCRSQIKHATTVQRGFYAYEIFQKIIEDYGNSACEKFVTELLKADLHRRQEMSQYNDAFGTIAEISVYESAVEIVSSYAFAIHKEFWEVWFSLGIEKYEDVILRIDKDDKIEREERKTLKRMLYKVFLRENEDEFVEEWKEEVLLFSKEMKKNFIKWKRMYDEISNTLVDKIDAEKYLAQILIDMQKAYGCRYTNKMVVEEVLANKDDSCYKKALVVLSELINQDVEYFPELTPRQVLEWITPNIRDRRRVLELEAYVALLGNWLHREEILEF